LSPLYLCLPSFPQKNDQGKEEAKSFSWKLVGQNNFSWGFFRSSLIRKKRRKKRNDIIVMVNATVVGIANGQLVMPG
jgi:hypothetical protein